MSRLTVKIRTERSNTTQRNTTASGCFLVSPLNVSREKNEKRRKKQTTISHRLFLLRTPSLPSSKKERRRSHELKKMHHPTRTLISHMKRFQSVKKNTQFTTIKAISHTQSATTHLQPCQESVQNYFINHYQFHGPKLFHKSQPVFHKPMSDQYAPGSHTTIDAA